MVRTAVVLACLLATGCTSTGQAPSEAAAEVDEARLSAGLSAMYAGDNPDPVDTTKGDCFADALLDTITPEELRAGGLLDETYTVVTEIPTLDEELAGAVADAQLGCTDFLEDATAAQVSITKGDLDAEAYAACLAAELDDEQVRASVVASLRGAWDDPALVRLSEAQGTCADQ